MRYRRRLRSRIVLSFLIFGTLLSGLFAFSALFFQDYITDQLISETLEAELQQFVNERREDPTYTEPFYSRIQGYVTRPGDPRIVPEAFRNLPSGVHEVETRSGLYRAAVHKSSRDDFWVFLTYDVSANRSITRRLIGAMIGTVVAFSALSFALGLWSAGRVMKPVRDLAERVRRMVGAERHQPLAPHFAEDEVGQLAAVIDDYAERLRDLVERDKAFNADVSHELRTPLAVITGATELLLAMPDLPEKARPRLLRIARSARQSSDIVNALLHLVRAERGTTTESRARDVGAIVAQTVDLYQPLIGNKNLRIESDVEETLSVIAPEAVIAVTVGNLLGNAIRYTSEGTVRVEVTKGSVAIQDQGPGIADDELPRVFERLYRGGEAGGKGAGLGLAIVKRLCELYGWEMTFANVPEGGLRAEVFFFPQTEQ